MVPATQTSVSVTSVIELFASLSRQLRAEAMADWVDLDITTAQLKVLFSLEHRGAASIGQVAEILGVTLPTASHLVDKLAQAGLIERADDPADRRRTITRLSQQGVLLVNRLREGGRQRLHEWLERLDDDELRLVHQGFAILARVASDHQGQGCSCRENEPGDGLASRRRPLTVQTTEPRNTTS